MTTLARTLGAGGEWIRGLTWGGRSDTKSDSRLGSVCLIGAGPGDPELITRKGWRALTESDVVIYDALVSPELMAEIPSHVRRCYVGKLKGQHSMQQAQICELIVAEARKGLRVARLKGGDPLVFGRLQEETEALRAAGIAFDIVPGITAASGCAASLNMPLTQRGQANRLRLITAHRSDDSPIDWASLAHRDETLVFYMGLSMAQQISDQLIHHGLPRDWPALLVQSGSCGGQRSVKTDLASLADAITHHGLQSPTLIMIGKVTEQADIDQSKLAVQQTAIG